MMLTGSRSFSALKPRLGRSAGRVAIDELVTRDVLPSGGAWRTSCAPIAPPAPLWFSTMNVMPNSALSRSATAPSGSAALRGLGGTACFSRCIKHLLLRCNN